MMQVLAERYRHRYPMGSAYVDAYSSRPCLNVRSERNRRYTTLGFVEAVNQDSAPSTDELIPAYRVAGDGFIGRMKSLFLVLDDDVAVKQPQRAGAQKKKNKRQASGDNPSETKKNKLPSTQ
jgi:hypothetical protein